MNNPFVDPYIVLNKVYSGGKYLKQSIAESNIEPANKNRTVAICYGVVERDIYLNHIISSNAQKSPKSAVRLILKIALYALESLKWHCYAVVDNAVELTKMQGKAGAAGFVNAAVTHYPMGSGNDFLRMFGPDAPRFYDLKELLDAPQAPMDLIDCNGHLALNVCSVGFDARIGLGAGDFKGLPLVSGTMAYQLSAVRAILQGIHRPYRVSIDGEELPGSEFTLMCACNGRYYGGGFNPSRTAMPDDGLLDFVVIPAVSRLTVVSLIGKYAKGGAGDIEGVVVRRGREMHVVCDRVSRINLDGEEVLDSELSVTVSAKKVNFFYPAGTHWDPARRGGI